VQERKASAGEGRAPHMSSRYISYQERSQRNWPGTASIGTKEPAIVQALR